MTAEHLRTGVEYDAALIWTEDATKDSFKVVSVKCRTLMESTRISPW